MRSGGPFDRSLGMASVAIDKYLSVQVQVPPYKAGREEEEKRERRSFAPSPVAASRRLVREERNQETRVSPLAALSGLSLADSTGDAERVTRDEGQATPMALSQSATPTTKGRLKHCSAIVILIDASSSTVLTTFDPLAIQKTYGKPLCAKYHLNRGSCQCADAANAIHDELTLSPAASKQLAVWAADQACPEGLGCADAVERKCCHWFHEPGAGERETGRDGAKDEADQWISVDKKGKPIVPSTFDGFRLYASVMLIPLLHYQSLSRFLAFGSQAPGKHCRVSDSRGTTNPIPLVASRRASSSSTISILFFRQSVNSSARETSTSTNVV